ncbi:MAG: ADP-ribosylglycohydrolase family protein [Deltaproteobacteria bacterium]|nr:ADP-ribosylglycohydrolase family protein [Deltaproteobacteria bacterium]
MQKDYTPLNTRRRRLQNALLGLFIGDALAMPAHWYYNLDNIVKVFDGGIHGYVDPPHPHLESFMVGMTYNPDLETAKRLGRDYDILHEHARFYNTSYSALSIRNSERENEHGNPVPRLDDRFHYHHGLKAGENTLAAHLVRVLMRSVIRCGRYDPKEFISDFIEYVTTPGRNRDPYSEIYIRRWFENYSRGFPPDGCAELQRNVWSIGSHGGIIRPLVVSTIAQSAYQGLGLAIEHQNLTHRSENVASALGVLVPLLHDLLAGKDPCQTISAHGRFIRLPITSGEKLFAAYRNHQGPGNIPQREMWNLHTMLTDAPYEVDQFIRKHSKSEVVKHALATACYPEHGLPLLLYFAKVHNLDVESALFANANAGGDNVHRGMILGLVVGAASDDLPEHLRHGLAALEGLQQEVEEFSDIALSGKGI